MAKLKLGAIITEASGKLGGQIISSSNGTAYIKNGTAKSKVVSPSQSLKRNSTKYLMSLWSDLTNAQRKLWLIQLDGYIYSDKFADTIKYNAFTLFQKLNQGRISAGLSVLLSPAVIHKPSLPQTISQNVQTTSLTLTSSAFISTDVIQIYATPVLSKGISKPNRYFRHIANVTSAELTAGIDIITSYTARFGSLVNNQAIWLGIKTISNVSGYSNGVLISNGTLAVVGELPPPTGPFYFQFEDSNQYVFQDSNNFLFN